MLDLCSWVAYGILTLLAVTSLAAGAVLYIIWQEEREYRKGYHD
jgi:hypothetical protein